MKDIPSGFTLRSGAVPGVVPAAVRRAIDALERLPFKEVIRSREVAALISVAYQTFQKQCGDPALAANRYDLRHNCAVWGSKKTIAELRRRMNES